MSNDPIDQAYPHSFEVFEDRTINHLRALAATHKNDPTTSIVLDALSLIFDLKDRHRADVDRLHNTIDEFRLDALGWRMSALDLFYGCACEHGDPGESHSCGFRRAQSVVKQYLDRFGTTSPDRVVEVDK